MAEKERLADFQRAEREAEKEEQRAFGERVQVSKAVDRVKKHGTQFRLPCSYRERRFAIRRKLVQRRVEELARSRNDT